jgi:predicted amidophosphoribosyltransferase
MFDTKRTVLGELLYRLKNKSDTSVIDEICEVATEFLKKWDPGVEAIVPVPASRKRLFQPCHELGAAIAQRINVAFQPNSLERIKDVPELKNIHEFDERVRVLDGIYEVDHPSVEGRRVLLVDDLYRSGATMNAASSALYDAGRVLDVFAFAITRTRSVS